MFDGISHDGSGWCWYINANMTGLYWWDPCYTIYSSTMDPSWVLKTCKQWDKINHQKNWWFGFPFPFNSSMGIVMVNSRWGFEVVIGRLINPFCWKNKYQAMNIHHNPYYWFINLVYLISYMYILHFHLLHLPRSSCQAVKQNYMWWIGDGHPTGIQQESKYHCNSLNIIIIQWYLDSCSMNYIHNYYQFVITHNYYQLNNYIQLPYHWYLDCNNCHIWFIQRHTIQWIVGHWFMVIHQESNGRWPSPRYRHFYPKMFTNAH